MKKLIIILGLCLTGTLHSQEFHKLAVVHSPGSWDDGYSVGLLYEHQNNTVYYGGEVYHFPDLHDITYTHFIGRFGFNTFIDRWETYRVYFGGRGGFIHRKGYGANYALLGIELGGDWFFHDKYFVGGYLSRDMKSDSAIWQKDRHMVNSVIVKLGIKF